MAKGKVELDLFSLAICHICRGKAGNLLAGFFYCNKHYAQERKLLEQKEMGIDMPVKT